MGGPHAVLIHFNDDHPYIQVDSKKMHIPLGSLLPLPPDAKGQECICFSDEEHFSTTFKIMNIRDGQCKVRAVSKIYRLNEPRVMISIYDLCVLEV